MSTPVETTTMDDAARTLLQTALGMTAPLNTNIHPQDQMFSFATSQRGSQAVARSEYFTSGAQLMKIVEQLVLWKFGSFGDVGAFLDFASGYGRLTRFLVQKLPADRVWVSDIQAEAVAFQEAEFGVQGFVSTVNPADLICDERFDCIFVASLFSHLPEATFTPWLTKLVSLLKPGGLLAFSVHDEIRLQTGLTMPDSGLWFAETSEIAAMNTKDYGVAIVSEAFVRNAILAATGRPAYQRIRYGLHYHQDLYLVVNEPEPDFSSLHFDYLPHGTAEYALWRAPGELFLRGWVVDMAGAEAPIDVQISVDGELRQHCVPSFRRADLREHFKDDRFLDAGWEATVHLPNDDPSQMVLVKAVAASGVESLLYLGSIDSLLPRGMVEDCLWTKPDELYVKGWVADVSPTDSPVEVQVFVNDQLRQKCLPFVYRPDLQTHFKSDRFLYGGWECTFRLPDADSSELLQVKSVSPAGVESELYLGRIDSLLPRTPAAPTTPAAEAEAAAIEAPGAQKLEGLRQLQAELDKRLTYIRHLEGEVARKNAALAALETRLRRGRRTVLGLRLPRLPGRRRSRRA